MTRRDRDHLDAERLLRQLTDGGLEPGLRAHVDACDACRARLEGLRALVADARSDELAEPPEASVARAVAAFAAVRPRRRSLREVVAELLTVDLGTPALVAAGVRGAPERSRLMSFRGAGLRVDLELQGTDGGRVVTAQAVPEDGGDLPVLAWCEKAGRRGPEHPIEEDGLVHLTGVPEPPFEVVLDLAARRLRLEVREHADG